MKKSLLLLISLLTVAISNAQDNNYWNQMPGSRSSLMGGAVVGGVRDNSAVFYNPGAIGFIDSTTLSISSTAYQYESASIQNGGGAGVNFTSGIFQTVPLVSISGVIKPNKKSKSTFGFMLFTKNQTSNSFSYRFDGIQDTSMLSGDGYTSRNAGVEYIGDYNLQTSLSELWGGLTYAYQINSHISVGASSFVAYRTQSLNQSFVARVYPDSTSNFYLGYGNRNQISSEGYDDIENITFSNIRLIEKIGIAFDYGNLKLGAAYTTQSINMGGSAMIGRDINDYGGFAKDSALYNSFYSFNDRQQKLKTTYTSPYSVSLGIEYSLGKTTIAFTGEYFGAVAAYDLATPSPVSFVRPAWYNQTGQYVLGTVDNTAEYLRILEASQSVTNLALAIQQDINTKLSIVASFRTDYTSYKKASNDFWEYNGYGNGSTSTPPNTSTPAGLNLGFSNIDLYHTTLGIILKGKKSDLNLGFSYTFGTNANFQPLNNISAPGDNVNNLGATPNYTDNSTYKYAAYSLLLGYTHHLK